MCGVAELRQHLPILLSQPLLQFNSLICLLIAIFHDHGGVERQAPLCCMAFLQSARTRNHNCILRDLERLVRSEEHTSELQSRVDLVCRLLLEKKKKKKTEKT